MSGPPQDETELYPLRWKIADAAEDLFVLHRGKAIAVCLALMLGVLLVGYSLFGGGSEGDSELDLAATRSSTSTSTTTTASSSSTIESVEVVPLVREVPDSALETSVHGPLILVESGSAILSGGLSTEGEADSMVGLAAVIFPGWNIDDRQQVNPGFEDLGPIIARIQGRRLFVPDSTDINPEFHSAIDQIAVFLISNPGSQVTLVAYSEDDTQPSQALASDRADQVVQRLRTTGVSSESIAVVRPGESPPALPRGLTASSGAVDFYVN